MVFSVPANFQGVVSPEVAIDTCEFGQAMLVGSLKICVNEQPRKSCIELSWCLVLSKNIRGQFGFGGQSCQPGTQIAHPFARTAV